MPTAITVEARSAGAAGTRGLSSRVKRLRSGIRSPDGAKRNPGSVPHGGIAPHFASLHAGYQRFAGGWREEPENAFGRDWSRRRGRALACGCRAGAIGPGQRRGHRSGRGRGGLRDPGALLVHAAGRARRLPARALLVTALSACPGKVGTGFPIRTCARSKKLERIPDWSQSGCAQRVCGFRLVGGRATVN